MPTTVFTNGCFDILHPGHVDLLGRAKELGTKLIVGINSDRSVRSIKGAERPFLNEDERKVLLLGLKSVDEVFIFNELTPESLIKKIKPDVLVKGGDWKPEEIIGADFVLKNGGKVYSLPLKGNFSSSSIVEKIKSTHSNKNKSEQPENSFTGHSLKEHIKVFEGILDSQTNAVEDCGRLIEETLRHGKKLLICGDGAAYVQLMASEFAERYETELTALSNGFGGENSFRQAKATVSDGDCLIAMSPSGHSPSVIAKVMSARRKNCKVVGLTGAKGKKLASLCDACVLIPSENPARIQEAFIAVAHIWRAAVDKNLRKS